MCDLFLVKFEMGKNYQIIKHGEIAKIFTINNCELFLLNTDFLDKNFVVYDTFDNISCPLYINIDIHELDEIHKGMLQEYNIYQLFNINGELSNGYDILGESLFNLEFYDEFMNTSSLDDYEDMISKFTYPKKINIKFRYDYYIHNIKFAKDETYQFYMIDNMILHLPNSNVNLIGSYNNIRNVSYNK